MPSVNDCERSGLRCGADSCNSCSAMLQGLSKPGGRLAAGVPLGQYSGSWRLPTKPDVEPALPVSAGFGARKPLLNVPRNENSRDGVNLKPALGVTDQP